MYIHSMTIYNHITNHYLLTIHPLIFAEHAQVTEDVAKCARCSVFFFLVELRTIRGWSNGSLW